MTDDARDRLRRIAYGPDATAQERAAAETALRQLDDVGPKPIADSVDDPVERNSPNIAGVAAGAAPVDGVDEVDDDGRETEPSFWGKSVRVAWLAPIVIGALAVGYFASLGSLDVNRGAHNIAGTESPAPSASTSGEQSLDLHLGDLIAADSWFERPFRESDAYPDASALEYYKIRAVDVRIASGAADKVGVWVGRSADKLCLLIADTVAATRASTCIDRGKFARMGIHLSSNDLGATWFGRDVSTDPPLESSLGAPHDPVSGPGSVAAANAWFDSAAPSSDQHPAPTFLKHMMGVDPTAVSYSRLEVAPWVEVWLAKQGAVGFCIASTDDQGDTNFGDCATNDEFQLKGLALSAFGLSMFWDGTSLSAVEVSAAGH
jgi:hypothetical protein